MTRIFKIGILTLLSLFSVSNLQAQKAISIGKAVNDDDALSINDIKDVKDAISISDTLKGWEVIWTGGFKGAQASYSNWSNGGVNTISVTGTSGFSALYREDAFGYALNIDFKYGLSYIDNQGKRKINDRLAINNRFTYLFGADNSWTAFANINFNTQFDQGYNYLPEKEAHVLAEIRPIDRTLISEFMAPAYFSQIAGLGYLPTSSLTFTAGLAVKETFVLNNLLSAVYGLEPGDNFRFEPGFSLGIQFEGSIMENLHIASSIETFTNFNRALDRTDVTFNTEIIGSINNYLSMTFQFVSIYDDDFSEQLQIKQLLAAGLTFTFL